MTPAELRANANKALASGSTRTTLQLVRTREPRGDTVKLAGNQGPVGDVFATFDNGDGRVRVVAGFKCDEVIAWLDKMESRR